MLEMYKGVANSPETTITNNINNTDTIIYVLDETRVPAELPNLMTLGTGTGAETIKVLSIDGNAITVERGFQGIAKAWNAGTIIARNFTEYDYNALVENVKEHDTKVGPLASLITRIKTSVVNALNGLQEDFTTHKTEYESLVDQDNPINTKLLFPMSSYIGFLNFSNSDDGTRVYILPKTSVVNGVGGALKIFGDAFQDDQVNYRDLGIYFSADQAGDTGYNGEGVFWINGKANGSFTDKNPDIAFSFQDGAQVAGRFARIVNGFGTYTVFVAGGGVPVSAPLDGLMRAEIKGNLGFRNNDAIKWLNSAGTANSLAIMGLNTNKIRIQTPAGTETYINNQEKINSVENYTKFNHAVIHNSLLVVSDNAITTPNVMAHNRIQFGQTAATTITNFIGQDGQRLTILFSNGNTTIQNNTNIRLQGAANFTGKLYDILTLEFIGSRWYEVSRSIN